MRISDWSSDVCSSDLMAAAAATPTGFLKGAFRTLQQQVRGDAVDRKNRHAATDRQMQRAPVARDGAPDPIEKIRERAFDVALFEQIGRSEEHTSELQSLMRISYAVFCLKKKETTPNT